MLEKVIKCVLSLWLMILYGAVHQYVEFYVYNKCSGVLEALYAAFQGSDLLALSTSLLLFGGMLYLACRKCNDKYYSISELLFEAFAIEVLWFVSEGWKTPSTGLSFLPLFHFIIILLISYIVANAVRYISNNQEIRGKRGEVQAFTIDTVRAENIDFIRAQYADNILAKLRGVDNDTDSYAIVVYGSWGTGKTTFLNCIKARLDERNENVFEFNPWNCSTPQQIVSDFFYLLADVLKQYDSSLSKPIVRYSELLDAVDAPKPLEYIGNLLSHQDDGITEMKEHIVNSLKKIRVPIYVLIDRMNKEEVLAVIRLIRNTANFPYLKFVVACDYNYIKKLLNEST